MNTIETGRYRPARPPRRGVAVPLALGLSVAALSVCALGGGSPRIDPASLLYVRPVLALLLAGLFLVPIRDADALRWPTRLLALWAATIAIQLVPLPPGMWAALPGHGRFGAVAELTETPSPWRPISLTPMLTWNALAALLPAWLGLVAASRLSRRELHRLPTVLLVVAGLSVVMGALQIASGRGYLYAVTSPGLPVGLFANRNHQAAFLAASLPLLAAWAWPRGESAWDRARPWLALGAALLLIVFLMVTGSRAGLGLGAAGVVAAALIAPVPALPLPVALRRGRRARSSRWLRVAPLAIAALAVVLAVALGRSLATERLVALTGTPAEQRAQALPTLLAMTRDFLPFGSGFGSFDPAFRIYEPDALLHRSVFNHAHDDLIEVALTGGVPTLAVLAAFLAWFAARTVALWRMTRAWGVDRIAIAAVVSLAILLAASLVDYPLRTPLLALVFALLTGVVARAGRGGEGRLVESEPRG